MSPTAAIQREIGARLLALSPRAFELFAGDLLVFLGLESVSVTRYAGDGGIDAKGVIVTGEGLFRLPTGVQVKRKRANVQRPDIERFIGALTGQYSHGIFLTNAGYSVAALKKASSSVPLISTIDGRQLSTLMLSHTLGVARSGAKGSTRLTIDEQYFRGLEEQTRRFTQVRESEVAYHASEQEQPSIEVPASEDLISLQPMSYLLHVDTTTIRRWVESGKVEPDSLSSEGGAYYFRRDRAQELRARLRLRETPSSGEEWRREFLRFSESRNLTRSYKPVLIRALLQSVDQEGKVSIHDLAAAFSAFYSDRLNAGLVVEPRASILNELPRLTQSQIESLIIRYPLDRLIIKGFVIYDRYTSLVHIVPELWGALRYTDVLAILRSIEQQIDYYYTR